MKKILAILGLLLCTGGFAYADEIASVDTLTPIQQVEVQNQLNRETFNKDKFNTENQYKRNFDKEKNSIKFDKSVKDKKFKNGQPPKFDKNGKPDFKPDRPIPKGDLGKRPPKSGDFRTHHNPPKHFQNKNTHKHNMSQHRHVYNKAKRK